MDYSWNYYRVSYNREDPKYWNLRTADGIDKTVAELKVYMDRYKKLKEVGGLIVPLPDEEPLDRWGLTVFGINLMIWTSFFKFSSSFIFKE